jgi:hypothetical protein
MKILFENFALPPTTISAPGQSENYPATNLVHLYLRKRYQTVTGADTIRFLFTKDQSVDSFYYGYNNASEAWFLTEGGETVITEDGITIWISTASMLLNLKDYLGNILYTETIAQTEQFGASHFARVDMVRSVEIVIDWSGVGGAYLGGVGIGLSTTLPNPRFDWGDAKEDDSDVTRTPAGFVNQDYAEPFLVRTYNFRNVSRTDYLDIRDKLSAIGSGRPVWIDCFEGDHTFMAPFYATVDGGIQNSTREEGGKYSFTLTFKEAR